MYGTMEEELALIVRLGVSLARWRTSVVASNVVLGSAQKPQLFLLLAVVRYRYKEELFEEDRLGSSRAPC